MNSELLYQLALTEIPNIGCVHAKILAQEFGSAEKIFKAKQQLLEKIEGIRINDYARLDRQGYDRKDLARKGGAAFFKMVLQDGLFHADPHPGNIFVLPDGRLGLVDFGIMGRVTDENMEYFASIFLALASHDYDDLVQLYIDMGFLSEETTDIEKFQREMKEDLVELPAV